MLTFGFLKKALSFCQRMVVPIKILYVFFHFHNYKVRGKPKIKGVGDSDQMIKLESIKEMRQAKIKEKKRKLNLVLFKILH